jgi:hypothetical protein
MRTNLNIGQKQNYYSSKFFYVTAREPVAGKGRTEKKVEETMTKTKTTERKDVRMSVKNEEYEG